MSKALSDLPELGSFLSTEEVAKLLNLAPQTLTDYRCRGLGPRYYKVGRRCLYLPADLQAWIASRVVDPVRREAA